MSSCIILTVNVQSDHLVTYFKSEYHEVETTQEKEDEKTKVLIIIL
jgi:hypothetical protein